MVNLKARVSGNDTYTHTYNMPWVSTNIKHKRVIVETAQGMEGMRLLEEPPYECLSPSVL